MLLLSRVSSARALQIIVRQRARTEGFGGRPGLGERSGTTGGERNNMGVVRRRLLGNCVDVGGGDGRVIIDVQTGDKGGASRCVQVDCALRTNDREMIVQSSKLIKVHRLMSSRGGVDSKHAIA